MLLKLIESDLSQLVSIAYEFYQDAEELDKEESKNLKIAALSFQITLITQYDLAQVNSEQMLYAVLKDFCTFDGNISTTLHNSLLSIVNRYIILHRDSFFKFLGSINLGI